MCGHVGVFGALNQKAIAAFETMLQLDMGRGKDGTGACFVNKKTAVATITKGPWLPFSLMRSNPYLSKINEPNILMMGHNRAATKGSINADNTHPFTEGDIILAHNGTLNGQWRLPDHKDYDNDSRNICHAMAIEGIIETWKKIDGAATLVWWDKALGQLSFLSNGMRSFNFCYINHGDAIAWCSDLDYLKEALDRADLQPYKNEFFTVKSDHQYSFYLNKKGRLVSSGGVEREKYTPPPVVVRPHRRHEWDGIDENDIWSQGGYYDPLAQRNQQRWKQSFVARKGGIVEVDPETKEEVESAVVHIHTKSVAFKKPPEEEFHKIYKKCCFCNTGLQHEWLSCVVIDEKSAACFDCSKTGEIAGITLRAS